MTKLERVFKTLKNKGKDGILENDLFTDLEKQGNVRKIKSVLNRRLGDKNAIYVKDGVWYLHSDFWEVGVVDFRELCRRADDRNNMLILTLIFVVIATVLILTSFVLGFLIGKDISITLSRILSPDVIVW